MPWISKLFAWMRPSPTPSPAPSLATYSGRQVPTPNHGGSITPRFIILHHSGGSFAGGVSWIKQRKSGVSYHYLIDSDGSRVQFVNDSMRAWHAGKSEWQGVRGLNGHSIGISFHGDTYQREASFAEVDSCAEKCIELMEIYKISIDNILSHAQIAPGRKNDPAPIIMHRVKKRILERTN